MCTQIQIQYSTVVGRGVEPGGGGGIYGVCRINFLIFSNFSYSKRCSSNNRYKIKDQNNVLGKHVKTQYYLQKVFSGIQQIVFKMSKTVGSDLYA